MTFTKGTNIMLTYSRPLKNHCFTIDFGEMTIQDKPPRFIDESDWATQSNQGVA